MGARALVDGDKMDIDHLLLEQLADAAMHVRVAVRQVVVAHGEAAARLAHRHRFTPVLLTKGVDESAHSISLLGSVARMQKLLPRPLEVEEHGLEAVEIGIRPSAVIANDRGVAHSDHQS